MEAQGDFEVAFHGEYRELVPDERIVTTEVFEMPDRPAGDPVLNVITFDEVDGRTMLNLLVQAPNQEIRDIIIESGMETGMQEQFDVLEQLASSVR